MVIQTTAAGDDPSKIHISCHQEMCINHYIHFMFNLWHENMVPNPRLNCQWSSCIVGNIGMSWKKKGTCALHLVTCRYNFQQRVKREAGEQDKMRFKLLNCGVILCKSFGGCECFSSWCTSLNSKWYPVTMWLTITFLESWTITLGSRLTLFYKEHSVGGLRTAVSVFCASDSCLHFTLQVVHLFAMTELHSKQSSTREPAVVAEGYLICQCFPYMHSAAGCSARPQKKK